MAVPEHDSVGNYCDGAPFGDPVSFIDGVESNWGSLTVVRSLNAQVAAAVTRANQAPGVHPVWHVVAAPSFTTHLAGCQRL